MYSVQCTSADHLWVCTTAYNPYTYTYVHLCSLRYLHVYTSCFSKQIRLHFYFNNFTFKNKMYFTKIVALPFMKKTFYQLSSSNPLFSYQPPHDQPQMSASQSTGAERHHGSQGAGLVDRPPGASRCSSILPTPLNSPQQTSSTCPRSWRSWLAFTWLIGDL